MSYTTHADLGGQEGFGPVLPEAEDVRFHEAWEPAALAIVLAMGATGSWNIDMSRSARETLPAYARLTYYRIWLGALEKLINDTEYRVAMVRRAQEKLEREYSLGRLRDQVLDVIAQAHSTAGDGVEEERKAEALVS